ncbi:MAG: hypothetical protein NZ774_06280 [Candidatus Poseidoniales archaeon]|nr:hypothetical protein [Candidatus Poseidoniales archaeon]
MADLLAMVVDSDAWLSLLNTSSTDLHQQMQDKSGRKLRPEMMDFIERRFDVDVEAEILDWIEEHDIIQGADSVLLAASQRMVAGADIEDIASGIWLLAEWASIGTWRCMEGRGFLYLEPYIGETMNQVGQLYEQRTWDTAISSIKILSKQQYSDAVVVDWMGRREQLGETLNEKNDPRILSTMQSHQRHAESLHGLAGFLTEGETILLTRRDWSSYLNAGFGGFNIRKLLTKGIVEGK